jgi:hypothetical protein
VVEAAIVEHGRLERHAQELAQLADGLSRLKGQVFIADGETQEGAAGLLEGGHVPQPPGH